MFTLDPGDSKLEGRSDELPVRLPEVQAVEFARLLSIFYPRDVVNGDLSTLEDWASVLRITHLYDFEEHRKLAITHVEQLAGPIDRIILAREYDIPAWLEPAYCALVIREESLTLEEGTRLGMADVILIARMRHTVRGGLFIPSQQVSYYVRDSLFSAQARSTT
ncbi:hypothetical protein BN946_scf185013.g81 [Trametes cinnabarina]|uniref:BTB domain-containing protein n=1 Tax=Pycnoporus cinnabarinus TaxID=5643 RepID=A0A060SGY6_PYCCI|nr:hypothetical protein BN946_scf185013.g81 [Trametes cinnabarina]